MSADCKKGVIGLESGATSRSYLHCADAVDVEVRAFQKFRSAQSHARMRTQPACSADQWSDFITRAAAGCYETPDGDMVEPHPMIEEEIIHLGGNLVQRVPKVVHACTPGLSRLRLVAMLAAPCDTPVHAVSVTHERFTLRAR